MIHPGCSGASRPGLPFPTFFGAAYEDPHADTALLAGLAFAQAAQAQSFDDRWYLSGSAGINIQDNDRGTRNAPFGTIGLGKMLNPNWSFDVELNYQNPRFDANQDLWWSQYGISFDARRHFMAEGRSWNPYVLVGPAGSVRKKNTMRSRARTRRASARTATSRVRSRRPPG